MLQFGPKEIVQTTLAFKSNRRQTNGPDNRRYPSSPQLDPYSSKIQNGATHN